MKSFQKLVLIFICISALQFSACEEIDNLDLSNCFEPINGTWVRINSSNPNGDCLKTVLTGDEGILLENPRAFAGWDPGTSVWKDIEHVEQFKEYSVQVLGSDGLYYPGTLELEDAKTIKLTIENSGSGNTQDWVKVEKDEIVSSCETSQIAGNWTRTESNNANNDGMRVKISNMEASLTFVPTSASSFQVNDLLWKELTFSEQNKFTLQVLGSDGNYYSGSIEVINTDKLELTIGSSGNGNTQIWER